MTPQDCATLIGRLLEERRRGARSGPPRIPLRCAPATTRGRDTAPGYANRGALVDGFSGRACVRHQGGPGHLAVALLERGQDVDAVEPNAQMRAIGQRRTHGRAVTWRAAAGERPPGDGEYALVTFGSSFNVVDTAAALDGRAPLIPGGTLPASGTTGISTTRCRSASQAAIGPCSRSTRLPARDRRRS